jgi:ion channel-forming bestrophin family protein
MVLSDTIPWKSVKLHLPVLVISAMVAAGALILERLASIKITCPPTPFTIAGAALAIFLAFRNSAAYDRWWEGRKLWGGLVNASRTLGRQVITFIDDHGQEAEVVRREVLYRHIAYLNVLRCQLRRQEPVGELTNLVTREEAISLQNEKNLAARLLHDNGVSLARALRRGWLSEERHARLDATLTEIISLQGACERIKGTPIPAAYRFFTRSFTLAFCVTLPLGLVEHLGLASVLAAVSLSFLFLVLETIGRFLEDPFTSGPNGLPLASLCRTIEINLRQQLDERELPPAIEPAQVNGVAVLL